MCGFVSNYGFQILALFLQVAFRKVDISHSINFLVMLLLLLFLFFFFPFFFFPLLFYRQPQVSSMPMPPFGIRMNDSSTQKPSYKWRRVLLKVSGEALAGDQTQNIDPKVGLLYLTCLRICALMLIEVYFFR